MNLDSQAVSGELPAVRLNLPMNTFSLYDDSGVLLAAMTGAANRENARREAVESARRRGARTGDTVLFNWSNPDYVPGAKSYIRFGTGAASSAQLGTATGGLEDYRVHASFTTMEFGAALPSLHLWGPVSLAWLWEVYWRSLKLNGAATSTTGPARNFKNDEVSAIQSPVNAIVDIELPFGVAVRPYVAYDVVSALDATLSGGQHAFLYGVNAEWTPGALVRLSASVQSARGNFEMKSPFSALIYGVGGSVYF